MSIKILKTNSFFLSLFAQVFFNLLGSFIVLINLIPISTLAAQEIPFANQLKAQVYLDDISPSTPVLLSPENNPSNFCQKQPLFSWSEATDNIAVTAYTFTLTGTTTQATQFSFSQTFSEATTSANYRIWSIDNLWYLQPIQPLEWGNYSWQVSASDKENNHSDQQIRHFQLSETICTFQCARDSQLDQIDWQTPTGSISTLRPAITFTYPENEQSTSLNIVVDGQTVLTNIDLTTSQKTSLYTTNLDLVARKITIQTENDYLTHKNISPSTWQVQFQTTDRHGCSYTSTAKTLTFLANITCTDAALIPQLSQPQNNFVDSNNQVKTFSWSICAPTNQFVNQSLTLNQQVFTDLGLTNLENNDYSYQVNVNSYSNTCDSNQLNFSLTLHNLSFLKTNDPLDSDDWNHWFVTTTDCQNVSLSSSTYRFRRYPQSTATYFWCNQTDHCQSGTLAECQATGKNCYYNDQNSCLKNASLDCSAQPPVKTYYWCQSSNQCNAGTLAECEITGKNCYLVKDDPQGNGCLQQAVTECSDQAQYFWCASQLACNLTDFNTCAQSGKPCYRQAYSGQTCPDRTKADCQPIVITAFTQSPWGSLYNLSNNGFTLLQKFGVQEKTLQNLEKVAILTLPLIALGLLLPLSLSTLLLPLPQGRLYFKKTLAPLSCALVKIEQDGQLIKQFFTDESGLFSKFSLTPGTYQLKIAYSAFLLDDDNKKEKSQNRLFSSTNFNQLQYTGPLVVNSVFPQQKKVVHNLTFINNLAQKQLLDAPPAIKIRHRFAHFLHQLSRSVFNFWTAGFLFTIIITWFYPSLLNVIVLAFYLLTLVYKSIIIFNSAQQLNQLRPFTAHRQNLKQLRSEKP